MKVIILKISLKEISISKLFCPVGNEIKIKTSNLRTWLFWCINIPILSSQKFYKFNTKWIQVHLKTKSDHFCLLLRTGFNNANTLKWSLRKKVMVSVTVGVCQQQFSIYILLCHPAFTKLKVFEQFILWSEQFMLWSLWWSATQNATLTWRKIAMTCHKKAQLSYRSFTIISYYSH